MVSVSSDDRRLYAPRSQKPINANSCSRTVKKYLTWQRQTRQAAGISQSESPKKRKVLMPRLRSFDVTRARVHGRPKSHAVFCLNKVKTQNTSATTDLKACLIWELLGGGVPDASVDYECGDGRHRFVVLCRGLRYELSFLERLLDASNAEDITRTPCASWLSAYRRAPPHAG